MTLRPFTIDDVPFILSWIKDKTAFRKWSADRYSTFPPKPEDMVAQYAADNIFPFTATDDEGKVVGHIMLRYPDPSKTAIRFGFVIVDDQLRGKGYGKQMLQLAIQKAKNEFGAKKITLGVFDNNPSAFHCYESAGFKVIGADSYTIDGEEWTEKEMEMNIIMKTKALVVIDIQNDITKHYRDIVDNINAAIDWAVSKGMKVVYIKHNNITAATRTFKPGTRGEELVPELKVVSENVFVKTKGNALTSEAFATFIAENGITEFYIAGADATACVKSTCFNMRKAGYTVHVFSDCVTSYDLKKLSEMLAYYAKQGCEVITLDDII